MAKILVYNSNSNRMETYYRGLSEAMPYITNRTLTVLQIYCGLVEKQWGLGIVLEVYMEEEFLWDLLSSAHGKVGMQTSHNIMQYSCTTLESIENKRFYWFLIYLIFWKKSMLF